MAELKTTVDEFVEKHLELLKLEKDAEFEEQAQWLQNLSQTTLERKGICIQNVKVGGYHTGMYGRCIITFEAKNVGQLLPSHALTVGDLAGIWAAGADRKILSSGVVTRITTANVRVAFEDSLESLGLDENNIYTLVKITSEVTFKRIKNALENLAKNQHREQSHFISVLFGQSEPSISAVSISPESINQNLNTIQKLAVSMALSQKEVAIIHGPPGTGKTTTVAEIVFQLVKRNSKILICAPSNIAVDNLLEKLSHKKLNMIRLGHPARALPSIQKHLLDSVLSRSDSSQVLTELKKEIDDLTGKMQKCHIKKEYYHYKSERQLLYKDLRLREKNELNLVLKKADVILSTITGASWDSPLKHLPTEHFDVVVIDECSQAIEASCWIPLSRSKKCILAGDHMQLPPTIYSKKAAENGFAVSLMERLAKMLPEKTQCVKLLEMQYRMHKIIMAWPSSKLYENKLVAHHSVANHLLKDLPSVEQNDITSVPLLFIDTAGCDFLELDLEDEDSKGNEGEADLVVVHVESLVKSGIKCEDIAVIAPYNLQVELIRSRITHKHPTLEVKSVDGFQGREKEAVILSLVRSNKKGEIGFLADNRRINVAVTRAKRHLVIIGDSETVSHDPFIKSLVDFVSDHGEVWPANQFNEEMNSLDSVPSKHISLKPKCSKPKVSAKASVIPVKSTSSNKPIVQTAKNGKEVRITISTKNYVKQPISDAEKERIEFQKRAYFEQLISEFVVDKERDSYRFPSTLSSFERMIVHDLAEKYNVYHISEGELSDRHVTLFKNQIVVSLKSLKLKDQAESNKETPASPCGANNIITLSNKTAGLPIPPVFQVEDPTKNKKQDVKKKDPQKTKASKRNKDAQTKNSDLVLEEAVAQKDICKCKGCNESIKLFGQICDYCKEMYCLAHCVPETHGCAQSVRAHSKKVASQEFKQTINGHDKKVKTVDPIKRIHLQRKLDKKLSELTNQRKGKK